MDPRAEGVYCRWESYPANSGQGNNLMTIERVNGDGSVSSVTCTQEESKVIAAFLANPRAVDRQTGERETQP